MLRLPYSVKELFLNWLSGYMPDRAGKIINQIIQMRNGKLNNSEFGKRFSGEGEIASAIKNLFEISRKKVGLSNECNKLSFNHFRKNTAGQFDLFE